MLQQEVLNFIKEDIKEIKDEFRDFKKEMNLKVDELLEFKWKIVGGSILASLLLTGLFQLVLAIVKH